TLPGHRPVSGVDAGAAVRLLVVGEVEEEVFELPAFLGDVVGLYRLPVHPDERMVEEGKVRTVAGDQVGSDPLRAVRGDAVAGVVGPVQGRFTDQRDRVGPCAEAA